MKNRYRIDWKPGMRLTDEIFRSSDEYYISCLRPLYKSLVNGDYGFLSLPIFRFEFSDSTFSVVELEAEAVTASGKLIDVSFKNDNGILFQNVVIPDTEDNLIIYLDISSDETVSVTVDNNNIPFCDADYRLVVKRESEHYSNPDAVPLARLLYSHGWNIDYTFVTPCINLKANSALLRYAANYVQEVHTLVQQLKKALDTDKYTLILSLLPAIASVSVEIEKEAEVMTPRHFIMLMQTVIRLFLQVADVEDIQIPQEKRCTAFVESYYSPLSISELTNEGIFLTHLLSDVPATFTKTVYEETVEERPVMRRRVSTDSIRKKHH